MRKWIIFALAIVATRGLAPTAAAPAQPTLPAPPAQAAQFVCEEDVRLAIKEGRRILIGERTIVTPSARDSGEAAGIFLHAGWPSVNS